MDAVNNEDEIFTLKARICKRCGRILTKQESVERGLGCRCAQREEQEAKAREPIPGQVNIYDWMESWDEGS